MTLSDICELIVDCPHSTAKDEGEGYPLIRTPNIGKGRLILNDVHRVSKEVYDKRNARAVPQDDDLILAREAPAGNVAIVKNGEKVCLGQRTVLIRPDRNKVYPDFLAYYILAPEQQYELLGTANGATVAHVNIPVIRSLPVTLPDMDVQKKTANILKAYDDLIENNQKQIRLLEEATQRLYKEWFVDMHFPGYEHARVIDGIPEGWKKSSILENDVFKLVKNPVTPFEGEKRYYATADVNSTQLLGDGELITYLKKPSRASVQPIKNSVWFARMSNSYKILNCFGVSNDLSDNSIISSGFAGFTSSEDKYGFVYETIASKWFDDEKNLYATGATQVSLTNEGLKRIEVLLPSMNLIKKYSQIVMPYMSKCETLKRDITLLKDARNRLLPKLMSGEIEV